MGNSVKAHVLLRAHRRVHRLAKVTTCAMRVSATRNQAMGRWKKNSVKAHVLLQAHRRVHRLAKVTTCAMRVSAMRNQATGSWTRTLARQLAPKRSWAA